MVFTIRDGDFHGLCYLLFSLLEILRPKKMDTPSLRVLDFLPFKASKKYGAPSKQNSAPWGSVHPWKIECQKETSENMHKICWQKSKRENVDTTYLLENVVKKLLVFPPPRHQRDFLLIPKAAARRIFEKKKKTSQIFAHPLEAFVFSWGVRCPWVFSCFSSLQTPSDIIPQFH